MGKFRGKWRGVDRLNIFESVHSVHFVDRRFRSISFMALHLIRIDDERIGGGLILYVAISIHDRLVYFSS